MSQAKRAKAANRFKTGRPSVMLAGEGSMAYGHSFSKCNNVILTAQDWAFDIWEQAISRAHRLDSIRDLNVYLLLCRGSIDEGIDRLKEEKQASAKLVLDYNAGDAQVTEADLIVLLQNAVHDFDNNQEAPVNETELLQQWPTLRNQFRL